MRRIAGLVLLTWMCGCSDEAQGDGHFDLDEVFSGPLAECLAETTVRCQASPSDRPALSCGTECSVVADLAVDCWGIGHSPTPRVAVVGEDTYLAVRSDVGAGLSRAKGGTWTAFSELPCGFERTTDSVIPARDPDGALYLLTDTHPKGTTDGGATLARFAAEQWTHEAVFHVDGEVREDALSYTPVRELLIGPDASPHAWFAVPHDYVHATRPPEGAWTRTFDLAEAHWWSLTPGGESIRLLRQAGDGVVELTVGPNGTEYTLGEAEFGATVQLVAPTPESEAAQPEIVALVHRPAGLWIHWIEHGVHSSFMISGTQQLDGGDEGSCVPSFLGVSSRGYTAARAEDGRLWIAWVFQFVDRPSEGCGDAGDGVEESTSDLHLARFDFATEELVHVLDAPQWPEDGIDIDMDMDGGRLSLAWMNLEAQGETLRLVQLDVGE